MSADGGRKDLLCLAEEERLAIEVVTGSQGPDLRFRTTAWVAPQLMAYRQVMGQRNQL